MPSTITSRGAAPPPFHIIQYYIIFTRDRESAYLYSVYTETFSSDDDYVTRDVSAQEIIIIVCVHLRWGNFFSKFPTR